VTIVVGAAIFYVFTVWLTPGRVRMAATAYADRLFEAAAVLSSA
jgi:hypothetical protein